MLSIGRPRRQMMTQQQRHNKRQRATPQQLAFLRKMFCEDPKPDQRKREEIGRKIDMTPRSVQIWFQNNRAKTKTLEERVSRRLPTITTPCDGQISRVTLDINDTMTFGKYPGPSLYMQGTGSFSTPALPMHGQREAFLDDLNQTLLSSVPPNSAYGLSSPASTLSPGSPPVAKFGSGEWISLDCTRVRIGSWSHMKSPDSSCSDLIVRYNPMMSALQYVVVHNRISFAIDFKVSCINAIQLHRDLEVMSLAHFEVEVIGKASMSMSRQGDLHWKSCADFTNGELLRQRFHILSGSYAQLEQQLRETGLLYNSLDPASAFTSPFQGPEVNTRGKGHAELTASPSPAVSPLSGAPYDDDSYPLQSIVSWQSTRPLNASPQISTSIDPSSPDDSFFDLLGNHDSASINTFWSSTRSSTPNMSIKSRQDSDALGGCPSLSEREPQQQPVMLDVDPELWLL